MRKIFSIFIIAAGIALSASFCLWAQSGTFEEHMYHPGDLKPVDSVLNVAVGDEAPDFTLTSISGQEITLSKLRGNHVVVLSFIPAAWTPVCSGQWPGYNVAKELFYENDAVLLGISVDNAATLHAWTKAMGRLWFPVLSDFWPHGKVAKQYGVLRSDGTAERALFIIDKKGIIRYIDVHDINKRPRLEVLIEILKKTNEDMT